MGSTRQPSAGADVRLHKGTLDDAIDFSCKPLNTTHGQPETRADRERRVKRYIERHPKMGKREIAEWCGVSETTAWRFKQDVCPEGGPNRPRETVGRDGKSPPRHERQHHEDRHREPAQGGA